MLEHPIRFFELLADVHASWNKVKMINLFVVKLTPLAGRSVCFCDLLICLDSCFLYGI